MVYSGQIGQTYYAAEMAIALPGMYIGMGQYHAMPYLNTASGVQAVYTITPPATVDASATYSIKIDNVTVSVSSGASTTTAQLGQLLFNAIRANGEAFRLVDASLNAGTGVITLTSRMFNVAHTITAPTNGTTTNDLTIATVTSPGTSTVIPYGRFVGRTASEAVDTITGISPAKLIDSTSGFTVAGVTMKTFLEKIGRGQDAVSGYPFQSTMSVLTDCVGIQGIWTECVEDNIIIGDTLYVATTGDNKGKATKTSTSAIDLSSRGRFITGAQAAPDGTPMVGVYLKRM